MTAITAHALIERLEHERTSASSPDLVIACDGDGTLWRGDIGEALFGAALNDRVLPAAAHEPLLRELQMHGLTADGDAHALARTLLHGFERGAYPEDRAFAMMAWVFVGWSLERMTAYADEVLDRFDFASAVRPEMRAVLDWAARHEVKVWLVSASQQQLVERAALRLGLPTSCVVGMAPNVKDGVLREGLGADATYQMGKVSRLRELEARPLLAAFGDSAFDAALLQQARFPVAVYPRPALRDIVSGWPNGLVLEG